MGLDKNCQRVIDEINKIVLRPKYNFTDVSQYTNNEINKKSFVPTQDFLLIFSNMMLNCAETRSSAMYMCYVAESIWNIIVSYNLKTTWILFDIVGYDFKLNPNCI